MQISYRSIVLQRLELINRSRQLLRLHSFRKPCDQLGMQYAVLFEIFFQVARDFLPQIIELEVQLLLVKLIASWHRLLQILVPLELIQVHLPLQVELLILIQHGVLIDVD